MPVHDFVRDAELDTLPHGWVQMDEFEKRIERIERSAGPLIDEQVLTYLCAYGYAIAPQGSQALARALLGHDDLTYDGKIWFEYLPVSPRNREGETHFDLALGDVDNRKPTRSGLEFAWPGARTSWIAAVEAKLRSDLCAYVRYDVFRNQLLRVIENAVTLRDAAGRLPDDVHVVLLTAKMFKDHPRSRFYGCKFEEYCPNGRVDSRPILADLDRLQLRPAHECAIAERLNALRLHWTTYEDVISRMPESPYKASLLQLVNREGSLVRV